MVTLIFFIITMLTTSITPAIQNPVQVLGDAGFSMEDRYANTYVSNVFADNILLTLAYMRGVVRNNQVDWSAVQAPFTYSFTLNPGQAFAFHNDVLPEFAGKIVKTTHITQSAEGDKNGLWTTVIAAAVLLT